MRPKLSPTVFSIVFCVAYAVLFWTNHPMFRYFPVPHRWAWGASDTITRPGPAMVWYGLIAGAALTAAAAAVVVPDRWVVARMRGWLWIWPVIAAVICGYLLRIFFL